MSFELEHDVLTQSAGWLNTNLGMICKIKGGKRLPKGRTLITNPNKHPYIKVKDMSSSKYVKLTTDFEYVDEETQKTISRYIVHTDDVILSIVGTIGLVSKVDHSLNGANLTENCVKLTELKGISSDFLYYYLSSYLGQEEFRKGTVGSTQPKLPIYNIEKVEIKLPPLPIQHKIANILSALDDKIELNNRMNKVLEQMAQAIFKQWFVDFEFPNENGEPYKSSGGEMVWCEELGKEIPKGWEPGLLSQMVTIKYGKDHKGLSNGNIPVYGSGGVMRYVDTALYSSESVLVPRKGTLNNVFYISEPFWSVDTMFYTEMKRPGIAKFIFLFLREKDLASMNVGSAVPSMTTDILNNLPIVVAPLQIFKSFDELVSQVFQQIKLKEKYNSVLRNLRDTLLPKLMSGEIDVSEIDV